MPRICPGHCSRLATAAVFIAVGVVQIIVGIILLRSKYVYLLAGPSFWTSICNIAVGCLLGLSASVWKQSKKRPSKKDDIRKNLLVSLLFSALMVNSTTLGIYLLGQGNALLSIRLESGQKYDASIFASEVLAYAYITSLCCPIICIVVAIVTTSGIFFSHVAAKKLLEMKMPVHGLEKECPRQIRWIYTPELFDKSRQKFRDLILSSSSESGDENDSKHVSVSQKSSYSEKDTQLVLNRMAQGKRDTILSDSAIMVRQMDLLRRSRGEKLGRDGSFVGPALLRSKKKILDEKCPESSVQYEDSSRYDDLAPPRTKKYRNDSEDSDWKRVKYIKNMQLNNPSATEKLLNEYRQAASRLAHHYPSMYKKFRETLKNDSEVDGTAFSNYASDVSDNEIRDTADGVLKKSNQVREDEQTDISTDLQRENHESSETSEEDRKYKHFIASGETAFLDDCFSPDMSSDFGTNSTFDVSKEFQAEEVTPASIQYSTAAGLKPTASSVAPDLPQPRYVRKYSEDSGIGNAECNSFVETENEASEEMKSKFSPFRENSKIRDGKKTQEYPKVGTQSIKKFDLKQMAAMEPISEEPNAEQQSKTEPVSESGDLRSKGAIPKMGKGHLRNKSLSCIEPVPSWQLNNDGSSSAKMFTPKRKRTASSKALRNMWSVTASESQKDFLDQVVDGDSLIGLSEEELVERQLRTRSIRKEVQKRMKAQVAPI